MRKHMLLPAVTKLYSLFAYLGANHQRHAHKPLWHLIFAACGALFSGGASRIIYRIHRRSSSKLAVRHLTVHINCKQIGLNYQVFKAPTSGSTLTHITIALVLALLGSYMESSDTMSTHTNTRSVELRQWVIEPLANHIDRPSLVMLSRVSREWNAGANTVLWRHLRSFLPLLRLLQSRRAGNIWVRIPICVSHKAV
jgi:hypothetical protein